MFSKESGRSDGLRRSAGTNAVSVGEASGHCRASSVENDCTVELTRPRVAVAAFGVIFARHKGVETSRFFAMRITVRMVSEYSAKDRSLARTAQVLQS